MTETQKDSAAGDRRHPMEILIAKLSDTIEASEAIDSGGAAESIRSDVLPRMLELAVLCHQAFHEAFSRIREAGEAVVDLQVAAELGPATVIEQEHAEKLLIYLRSSSQIVARQLPHGQERDVMLQAASGLIQFVEDHTAAEEEEEAGNEAADG